MCRTTNKFLSLESCSPHDSPQTRQRGFLGLTAGIPSSSPQVLLKTARHPRPQQHQVSCHGNAGTISSRREMARPCQRCLASDWRERTPEDILRSTVKGQHTIHRPSAPNVNPVQAGRNAEANCMMRKLSSLLIFQKAWVCCSCELICFLCTTPRSDDENDRPPI